MIQIRNYFEAITPLTDQEWNDLAARLKKGSGSQANYAAGGWEQM
jgi:hypothetical protein